MVYATQRPGLTMNYAKISLVMELPFDTFGTDARSKFLDGLSELAGVPRTEIRNESFWKGCVKFEANIDVSALDYLLELYRKAKQSPDSQEITESVARMIEFIDTYKISKISGEGLAAKLVFSSIKESADEKPIAFFIHGWRGEVGSFAELPEYVSDELNIETSVYAYPTAAFGSVPSIYFVAQNFDNWIRNQLKSDSRKFAIISHSMGGLITRKMIASQMTRDKPLDVNLRQLTFIASPSTGVWIAKASAIMAGAQSVQTSELSPGSAMLADIVQTWAAWSRKSRSLDISVRSIYGTADHVVDTAIAINNDPEAVPILGAGHIDIVKPHDKDAEIVRTLTRFLSEAHFVGQDATA